MDELTERQKIILLLDGAIAGLERDCRNMRDLSDALRDTEIKDKAIARYLNYTHNADVTNDGIIIFLQREIDHYRKKIDHLEACIGEKNTHIRELENTIEKMRG